MLAAVNFNSGTGELEIVGNANDDTILLTGSDDYQSFTVDINNNASFQQTFSYSAVTSVIVLAGDGADTVINTLLIDTEIFGGDGDDYLEGGYANDRVIGGNGSDTLVGRNGDDVLNGQAGNDKLSGLYGDDALIGQAGNDQLLGGGGNDALVGDEGVDVLRGEDGNDILRGGDGDDILFGGSGNDTLSGEQGNDRLRGEDGDDTLHGDEGDDELLGQAGNDVLLGGDDNDTIYGREGDDTLRGDAGNDRLFGGLDNDIVQGNDGIDLLHGGGGDDTLRGGEGDDSLYGLSGRDRLFGDAGSDLLDAGGDYADDVLTGGSGVDQFVVLGNFGSTSVDIITDLEAFETINGNSNGGDDGGNSGNGDTGANTPSAAIVQLADVFSKSISGPQIGAFAQAHVTEVEEFGDLKIVDTGVRKIFFRPVVGGFGAPVYRYGGSFSHLMPNELADDLNTLALVDLGSTAHVIFTGTVNPADGTLVSEVVLIGSDGDAEKIGLVIEDRGSETYQLTPTVSGDLVNNASEIGFGLLGRPSEDIDLDPYTILFGDSDFNSVNYYVAFEPPASDDVKIVQAQAFVVKSFAAAAAALDAKAIKDNDQIGPPAEKSFLTWANNEGVYASQGRDLTITPGSYTFGKDVTVNIISKGGEFDAELTPTKPNGQPTFTGVGNKHTAFFVETKNQDDPFDDRSQTAYQLAYIANLNKKKEHDIAYVKVVPAGKTSLNTIRGLYKQKNVAASNVKVIVIEFDFDNNVIVKTHPKKPPGN